MQKNEIRAEMRAFLGTLGASERHERSLAACERLAGTREFREAHTIMLFLSMPMEVETSTLALKAWSEDKAIAVPRMDWESKRMEPLEITSLETNMATVGPGIRQPMSGKVVPLDLIDLVIVPGLAFDRRGYRVGRGRGFYDRFLAQRDFQGVRCALGLHEQLLAEVPFEEHDIPMDLVVTDQEVVRCARRGGAASQRTQG